jgi:LacI family transcriptional regulator
VKQATIKDVAKKAGVSIATVSYVVNDKRFVSDPVRKKVLHAIKELDYQRSDLARSLRQKKTLMIGLVIPDNTNPYFAEIARGMEDASFDLGYNVIFCNTDGNSDKEVSYIKMLTSKGIDGITLVPSYPLDRLIPLLKTVRIPLVLLDRHLDELETDAVYVDNVRGGQEAVKYLLDLGHRRIACISGPQVIPSGLHRLEGYQKALAEAGIPFDKSIVYNGNFHSKNGYEGFQELMKVKPAPTAIFACNDLMALGVLSAAHKAGLRIPEDLSVIGYDDVSFADDTIPPLTTMAQPKYRMGQIAAKMMVDRLKDPSSAFQKKPLLARLITRDTCGPVKGGM